MIRLYLRQAWQMLRQNPLYSTMYIAGTGLAIALTMTLVLIYYIKLAPVYPETNRGRTMVMKLLSFSDSSDSLNQISYSGALSYEMIESYLYPLKSAEAVSAYWSRDSDVFIELPQNKDQLAVRVKYTDVAFWKVFEFNFLSGKPFTEEEFQSGIRTAVLSESLAQKIFGSIDVEGRSFLLDFDEYKVSGVVKDASFVTPTTFAQLWIPISTHPGKMKGDAETYHFIGSFSASILAPDRSAMKKIKQEVEETFHRVNTTLPEGISVDLLGYPESYQLNELRDDSYTPVTWRVFLKEQGLILFALLLIPAVNLAGMISSRVEKRLPEFGLRKAFGASRKKLLAQLLVENLLLTCLGGIAGLFIAYILMWYARNWILSVFDSWPQIMPDGIDVFFTPDMLFAPMVFGITFCICFVLNFLSVIYPTFRGLSKDIVYSLHDQK